MVLPTLNYRGLSFLKTKQDYLRTHAKKSASIGANATIVCGVTIGEYALIGSGAVVTKDVPPFTLVVGNQLKLFAKLISMEISYKNKYI